MLEVASGSNRIVVMCHFKGFSLRDGNMKEEGLPRAVNGTV